MNYIAHRRFNGRAICGKVNIPAMTVCEEINGIITLNGNSLCWVISENAHQFFAVNNDGLGMERGSLTQRILKKLSLRDKEYDSRWDKVWGDKICLGYKRPEYEDHWIWSHAFYGADVETLKYIANLIKA